MTTRAARALLSEMWPCDDRDHAHSTPGGTWHMSSNRMESFLASIESQARAQPAPTPPSPLDGWDDSALAASTAPDRGEWSAAPTPPDGGPILPGAAYTVGNRGPEEVAATTPPDALREALEIIAASPFPAMSTDAIGITARNIARLALRPTSEPGRLWREAAVALATPAPLDDGLTQRAHVVCCWCGEHHEEGD